jgi:hypothetical protein
LRPAWIDPAYPNGWNLGIFVRGLRLSTWFQIGDSNRQSWRIEAVA